MSATIMSSSSTSVTPAKTNTTGTSSSTVPTDLTVSSTDSSDQRLAAHNRHLQHQIKLLETEVSKRDSQLEKQRREYEDKILLIEANKQEAIETHVELRLAVHAREMNKVQMAINTQLEQVIARQKYLETVNVKLRKRSEDVKYELLNLKFDSSRFEKLKSLAVSDMSLSEFTELIIYKNLSNVSRQISDGDVHNKKLQEKINQLSENKLESEILIGQLKSENEKFTREIKTKSTNLEEIQKDVLKLDKLNSLLQERLNNYERSSKNQLKKEETIKLSQFRSPGWPSNDDSDKVLHNLNNVANNCLQIQTSCQQIHHQNEAGFSKLVSITQEVQQRQFDLLDKFSHHVRVTKIDEKYKEQYLETIKQLVHEQVRTQTYISRLVSERDQLMGDINKLTTQLSSASMDLVEEEVNRCKLQEQVKYLEGKIHKMEMTDASSDQIQKFKNTEEYKNIIEDMKLLLQHREEISEIKNIIRTHQEQTD